ncbi:recombinase family protein [Paenibacillus sp. FSL R5-0527]|uniref:recombinase family protein n=1 Tax=Paenibacillus sp. FSL R5-0527 TaxID=2975321 RepID=UPI00097AEBF0|nr:hypothetical protein BK140_10305 [Paenibacillus macerans]
MSNFIYARSAVGSKYAVEVQVENCLRYAEQMGLKIDGIFQDKGFSGLDNNRPCYSKLLEVAEAGDTIIVSSAGLIHRNMLTLKSLEAKYNLIFLDRAGN